MNDFFNSTPYSYGRSPFPMENHGANPSYGPSVTGPSALEGLLGGTQHASSTNPLAALFGGGLSQSNGLFGQSQTSLGQNPLAALFGGGANSTYPSNCYPQQPPSYGGGTYGCSPFSGGGGGSSCLPFGGGGIAQALQQIACRLERPIQTEQNWLQVLAPAFINGIFGMINKPKAPEYPPQQPQQREIVVNVPEIKVPEIRLPEMPRYDREDRYEPREPQIIRVESPHVDVDVPVSVVNNVNAEGGNAVIVETDGGTTSTTNNEYTTVNNPTRVVERNSGSGGSGKSGKASKNRSTHQRKATQNKRKPVCKRVCK
jgi:hypothetical protein